jgi:hypothetical protein
MGTNKKSPFSGCFRFLSGSPCRVDPRTLNKLVEKLIVHREKEVTSKNASPVNYEDADL